MKEPFLNKTQIIYGVILGICAFVFSLGVTYFESTVSFDCFNGTILKYNKSTLSQEICVCGSKNPYIYNNNNGFGVYLPNEQTKLYMKKINDDYKKEKILCTEGIYIPKYK